METFKSMYEDDTFKDFTFFVRGRELKVHKSVMGAASEVFRTMLTCGLDETKNNAATVECDPKIFEIFLRYVYVNAIPSKTRMLDVCIELHELAHRYGIKLLERICIMFVLQKEINETNAMLLYEFALHYKVHELIDKSLSFIKNKE